MIPREIVHRECLRSEWLQSLARRLDALTVFWFLLARLENHKTGRSARYVFDNHVKWIIALSAFESVFEDTLILGQRVSLRFFNKLGNAASIHPFGDVYIPLEIETRIVWVNESAILP